MKESTLERRCVVYARARGCWCLKLWPVITGLPDRILLMPRGRVHFVEFKATGGRVSPRQARVHQLLRALGFKVSVVWAFDTFCALERILNAPVK